MNQDWPTQEKDLDMARVIMEEYAKAHETDALGLFELVIDPIEKKMNFRLSGWIDVLASHFYSLYGSTHGDLITRNVITRCITQGQTVH